MGHVNLNDRLGATRKRLDREQAKGNESVPKFQQLIRKEARVREDQYAALSALARMLMRSRAARAERITENTLIRIAIDLLLEHRDLLRGSNEDALRKSASSGLRNTRRPEVSESRTPSVPDSRSPQARQSRSPADPEYSDPGPPHAGTSGGRRPGAGSAR